jgi:alkylhydroperoxidase family enzyme
LGAFVLKLAKLSGNHTEEDLGRLREAGWTDGQILEAIHVVGFFSHINRVAEATGVDPEGWMPPRNGRSEGH